ncbi:flagellar hook-basal body protein [Baekduia soli]|nr:flagellar hook-basal body protein [Baekduia soli]
MAAQQTRLDAVATDLANTNTTGYKHARVAFRDLVYDDAQGYGAAQGVRIGAGSAATPIGRATGQGALQSTGRALDIALEGPGFIQVKLADGTKALTRDGNLDLDVTGKLRLSTGEYVEPPVTLPAGTDPENIGIAPDGTVSIGGRSYGRLTLLDVAAPGALTGGPDNTLIPGTGSGAARGAGKGTIVHQGTLEASDVDEATAMTDMIEAQRAFQLASKAIQTQDQILEIANQVKR